MTELVLDYESLGVLLDGIPTGMGAYLASCMRTILLPYS